MEAVTLPYESSISQLSIDQFLTHDQKLVASLQLSLPRGNQATIVTTLNSRKQVTDLEKKHESQKMLLRLHGIPTSTATSFLREYVLLVFQTDVLLMYRTTKSAAWLDERQLKPKRSFQRVDSTNKSKEVRKVQALAIRAVYAMGLDYGMVKCGVAQGNQVVVSQINPHPRVTAEMQSAFLTAVKQYVQEISRPKTLLKQIQLGADPEFIVKSPKGDLVIASKYLPFRGKVGCDAIWIGQNRAHKPLVEVRPEPSPDPRKIVIRIYEGLILAGKKMNAISGKWLAGGLPYPGFPLGGHIHFSGIKPNFKLLRALDNYLTFPLITIEDEKGVKRRPKYGFLGDYRVKSYGGFEYRTLPSWLVSPTLTKGVLALAKVIVANYRSLQRNPLQNTNLQRAYYQGYKSAADEWLDELWDELRGLVDYQVYATYLDPFYRLLASGRKWDETKDFRHNWKLPPFHQRR